eukprot:4371001-Amphidinium_carterae.1
MAKALTTLNPAALGDQKITGNLILATWSRLEVQKQWPDIVDACGSKIDAWLTKVSECKVSHSFCSKRPDAKRPFGRAFYFHPVLHGHGNSSTPPDVWLRENEDVVHLLLPKDEVKSILALAPGEKLTSCMSEVCSLWAHCDLGKALFSGAMKRIAIESIDRTVTEAMESLVATSEVTESTVTRVLQDASTKMQFMAGIDEIGKHNVVFQYRGVPIEHCCPTPLDQVEYSMRKGCQDGGLTQLPGEDAFVENTPMSADVKVASSLLAKANRVRDHLVTLNNMQKDEDKDGDKLQALLDIRCAGVKSLRHDVTPRGLCRGSASAATCKAVAKGHGKQMQLDFELLQFMLGETGATMLRTRWVTKVITEHAATADKDGAAKQSASFVTNLAVKWAPAGLQEELNGANDMVQRMYREEAIANIGANLTPRLTGVGALLQAFIVWCEPKPSVATSRHAVD